MKQQVMRVGVFLSILLLLAGCGWLGGDKNKSSCPSCPSVNGEPLICFGTKTVMSFEEFKKKIEMLKAANPAVEGVLSSLPPQEQFNMWVRFAEGCITGALAKAYMEKSGAINSKEYQEMSKQAHEALEEQLALQGLQNAFIQQVEAKVNAMSKKDLEDYYNQHKNNPAFAQHAPGKDGKNGASDFTKEDIQSQRETVKQAILPEFFDTELKKLKEEYGVKIEEACLHRLVVKKEESAVTPVQPVMDEKKVSPQPAPTPVKAA
jgi:hypothetical protein